MRGWRGRGGGVSGVRGAREGLTEEGHGRLPSVLLAARVTWLQGEAGAPVRRAAGQ